MFGYPVADVGLTAVRVVGASCATVGELHLEPVRRIPEPEHFMRGGHRVELALLRHLPLLADDPVQVGQECCAGRRQKLGRWGRDRVYQLVVVVMVDIAVVVDQQFGGRGRQRLQTGRPAVLHVMGVLLLVVMLLLVLLVLQLLVVLVRLLVVVGELDRFDGFLLVDGRSGRGERCRRRRLRYGTGELTRGGRQRQFGRLPLDGAARRVVGLKRHVATGRRTSRVRRQSALGVVQHHGGGGGGHVVIESHGPASRRSAYHHRTVAAQGRPGRRRRRGRHGRRLRRVAAVPADQRRLVVIEQLLSVLNDPNGRHPLLQRPLVLGAHVLYVLGGLGLLQTRVFDRETVFGRCLVLLPPAHAVVYLVHVERGQANQVLRRP